VDLKELKESLSGYFLKTLMNQEADPSGCFIEIRAGAGGAESCDWVSILSRMYTRWGVSQGYSCKVVDEMRGEIAGYKSISLEINGEYAYGWAQYETGVHRFVRVSPFDSNVRLIFWLVLI
jgi:peptide chain release factor 2